MTLFTKLYGKSMVALVAVCALLVSSGASVDTADDLPFQMLGAHLNLVLSVTDADKTHEFYGTILGLKRIPNIDFPGDAYMIRYMGGDSEIKFIVTGKNLPQHEGGARNARGIRLMALTLPKARQSEIVAQLKAHDLPAPKFIRSKSALLEFGFINDFDDNQIELIFYDEGAPESLFDRLQIGLTVSDTDAMNDFLRETLRLKELDPVELPGGIMKYNFQLGTTTIKFWSLGKDLPSVTTSPFEGIGMNLVQFLVADVEAVHTLMKERGATIAAEPFQLGKLATIMFVEGPDGILFEFAGPPTRHQQGNISKQGLPLRAYRQHRTRREANPLLGATPRQQADEALAFVRRQHHPDRHRYRRPCSRASRVRYRTCRCAHCESTHPSDGRPRGFRFGLKLFARIDKPVRLKIILLIVKLPVPSV